MEYYKAKLEFHFKLTLIFVVLYKYLYCAAITYCNYLLQKNTVNDLIYYFLVQALICTYTTWLKPSFAK